MFRPAWPLPPEAIEAGSYWTKAERASARVTPASRAAGHMDFLKSVGDPATDVAFDATRQNLQSAIEGETFEYTQMYPGMAKTAREEGFPEIGEWFETLA